MERYKSIYKEDIEGIKKENIIFLSYKEIIVSDPFSLKELNFKVEIPSMYNLSPEKIKDLYADFEETNNKINKIRKVLYNYVLGEVSLLQKKVVNTLNEKI